MPYRTVAEGVHLLEHAAVNLYLIEDEDGLTLVDSRLPATFGRIAAAVRVVGRSPGELRAVVLTHAHFDHVGSARRIQQRWGAPIYVHSAERYLTAHPHRYRHERARLWYPLRTPLFSTAASAMPRADAGRRRALR